MRIVTSIVSPFKLLLITVLVLIGTVAVESYLIIKEEYETVYIAVKQVGDDKILVWTDEAVLKYGNQTGYMLKLNGKVEEAIEIVRSITIIVDGKETHIVDVKPVTREATVSGADIILKVRIDR